MTKTLTIALAVAISAAIFLTGCSATVVGVGSREALVADIVYADKGTRTPGVTVVVAGSTCLCS